VPTPSTTTHTRTPRNAAASSACATGTTLRSISKM
jgi:hypothetical protein